MAPPPPSIAEVIPAFARGGGAHSGQLLRVYLDRPWLVTGEGEELAVVVDPSGSIGTVDPVRLGVVRDSTVKRSGNTVDITITGVDELGNQMQARLEAADKSIADPDLRWQPLGDPIRLVRTGAGDNTLWSGTLDVTGATDPLRVVVEELEPGRRDEAGVPVAVENVIFIDVFEIG